MGNFPKFRPKNSKLSILTENWLTWYLGGADSKSRLRFLKFQPQTSFSRPKKSKLFFLSESWHTWYLKETDTYSNISFLNFPPKINFWGNLGQKSHSCPFFLKIGTRGISRMLIFIPTLVFSVFNQKPILGQIWAEKVKVVSFVWKLVHMVSSGCWFLLRHYFSEFQSLEWFFGKFSP